MSCVSWTFGVRPEVKREIGVDLASACEAFARVGVPELHPHAFRLLWSGAAPPQPREPPSGPGTSPARGHPDDDHLHETHAIRSAEGSQCVRQEQWGRKQGFASRPPRHLNSGAKTPAISSGGPNGLSPPLARASTRNSEGGLTVMSHPTRREYRQQGIARAHNHRNRLASPSWSRSPDRRRACPILSQTPLRCPRLAPPARRPR
jgi:hypothetical protein